MDAGTGDGGVRLSLVQVEDERYIGSALVDVKYGVVTRFEISAQKIFVRDLNALPQ